MKIDWTYDWEEEEEVKEIEISFDELKLDDKVKISWIDDEKIVYGVVSYRVGKYIVLQYDLHPGRCCNESHIEPNGKFLLRKYLNVKIYRIF